MVEWKEITPRVKKMRERYRTTTPHLCTARFRLVTDFYMNHMEITGILKRAWNIRNLFENLPVLVNEDELIVGEQGTSYRASALYPEVNFQWLVDELTTGDPAKRESDPYIVAEEDKEYILSKKDFWLHANMSAMFDAYLPVGYQKAVGNGVLMYHADHNTNTPVGHFITGYNKACTVGFRAVQKEAEAKMEELERSGIMGKDNVRYNFYHAVSIVAEGIIIWSRRYAKECARLAEMEKNPERKAELLDMAERLDWIMENPCRTFHDALQCIYLYHLSLCLDGQQHGISLGRLDQYLGKYYEADIAAGRITPEKAQELLDLFYLKLAEANKMIQYNPATIANPGYTSGFLITLGGVDRDGKDASNAVSYMMLQSAGRLILHTPPQALRIHKGTPNELWELAIETTKRAGGVPTFESDDTIIPALIKRGLPIDSARNYSLVGCVEPTGTADEWAQPGGTGCESYINLTGALVHAINNGTNPMPYKDGKVHENTGLQTGYLYEMESMDQFLDAVKKQMEYFIKWHVACETIWESVASIHHPLPLVSCMFEGCMESGLDVMWGGAKYNSTGNSAIGLGNVADSLNIINYMCFEKKLCTTREMYDAVMANWEGYEELRQIVINEVPHYGNANPEADKFVRFVAETYADAINSSTGPRGRWSAGMYPVTMNTVLGRGTWATPDGRLKGTPLSDGISPVQGMDKSGPLSSLNSVLNFDQTKFANGTLLNMKFHPTALKGAEGNMKLKSVIQTYFDRGGMEMQLNIVDTETLRAAQQKPEEYKDLVVRVAGFSAYFVEVFKDCQEDLIRRTEMGL
ncbi:MAG: hypothetical protein K6E56_06765 [Lachnospiraceae bacterium]|nr:hypothetical protein [Lachnospiraceae bacterium]